MTSTAPDTAAEPGQLLGAIFSASPDAIIVIDQKGTIVLSNPAVTTLFGYYPEELVGASVSTLVPLDRRELHDAHIEEFFAAPHPRRMGAGLDLVGRRRDGSSFPVDVSLTPVDLRAHRFAAAFIRDASQRERDISRLHAVNEITQMLLGGARPEEIYPKIAASGRLLSRSDAA